MTVSAGGQRVERASQQREVLLPADRASALCAQHRLLRGLLATGVGYGALPISAWCPSHNTRNRMAVLYCARGQGWCRAGDQKLRIGPGELLVFPPDTARAFGTSSSEPWSARWVTAIGELVSEYLAKFGALTEAQKLVVGDDLDLVLLFDEILSSLAKGCAFANVFTASTALGYLLARCLAHSGQTLEHHDGFQKIGRCIEFMSEHLDEPIKVTQLAAAAGLSPAHFAAVFKEQTGSAPREYLHLLRMHRARQWLTLTRMSLKEIASKLGYQDQFHFSHKFKSFTGVSPSRYRDRR